MLFVEVSGRVLGNHAWLVIGRRIIILIPVLVSHGHWNGGVKFCLLGLLLLLGHALAQSSFDLGFLFLLAAEFLSHPLLLLFFLADQLFFLLLQLTLLLLNLHQLAFLLFKLFCSLLVVQIRIKRNFLCWFLLLHDWLLLFLFLLFLCRSLRSLSFSWFLKRSLHVL